MSHRLSVRAIRTARLTAVMLTNINSDTSLQYTIRLDISLDITRSFLSENWPEKSLSYHLKTWFWQYRFNTSQNDLQKIAFFRILYNSSY